MKIYFLMIFTTLISQASPSVQFKCSIANTMNKVPLDFQIYVVDANQREPRKNYIDISPNQHGFIVKNKKGELNPVKETPQGNTVDYKNHYAWISLINRGGPVGRWDGNIRFNNSGTFYDGNDSLYNIYCQINPK